MALVIKLWRHMEVMKVMLHEFLILTGDGSGLHRESALTATGQDIGYKFT
jgi:hypothetical protein